MATLSIITTNPELGVRASRAAPIIIASDGRPQSDAALVVGRIFAEHPDALRLVSVVKPVPGVVEAQIAANEEMDRARRVDARRELTNQIARTWQADDVAVELPMGDPATVITRIAHRTGATMIVAGLGRHRVMDRVFGDETALRLVRMADVPVFCVATELDHAPRRIVVAADFSETSLRAARLAIELASPCATIYVAHVIPRDSITYDVEGWGTSYKRDAGDALQRVQDQLRVPKDMTVQRILLQGDPATELLAFAASVNADLIATGSHGRGFVARMLVGSVTTRLVRCSTCSVLTVPHAAVMTRVRTTVEPPSVETIPADGWAHGLAEFARRNLGRRGTLEIDDPDVDAQGQVFDYPLVGADWDHRDGRVQLMLGGASANGPHLTHTVGGVTSIAVMRDDRGRDIALRVAHGSGLTLFTFTI
jgi:nucleotide-binding universal stress UspA family protein